MDQARRRMKTGSIGISSKDVKPKKSKKTKR